MQTLNETHDATLRSWLDCANRPETDFPIQNLPFAVFRRSASDEDFRGGVAIGDYIVDLRALQQKTELPAEAAAAAKAASGPELNPLMELGHAAWSALRLSLSRLLREGAPEELTVRDCLIKQQDAEYQLPCKINDFTDFYTSIYHATAVGSLFRPDNPLLPNYKWVPIGYHGRASSIGISGQTLHRPAGQIKAPDADAPVLMPCKRLDYELEMGIVIGSGNPQGSRVGIGQAEQHVFGICLLNDWSARDIQAWEYQPLGPFLAKSFASTISPWIVTMEALAPYRQAFKQRDAQDPQPLPYLSSPDNSRAGALDIELEVLLLTDKMRAAGEAPVRLSASNFKHSYWTVAQLVTHHTVNGCNLQAGDLLGSGTQSGPEAQEGGSILELTQGGKQPITLPNGETRTFLEDGDTVIMRGHCATANAPRIGFGEVSASILPALALEQD